MMRSASDRTDLTGSVDPHHAVAPIDDRTDLTGIVDSHHAVAPRSSSDRTDLTGIVDPHHAVAPRSSSDRTDLTGIVDPHHAVAPMIIPPDGGWGWIIVFTGFFTCAITDGVAFCFYLFKEPMAKDLHVQEAEVAFMSALYSGFYFIGGIVACSVGNYWGFRKVLFLGGFMSALSFGSGYVIEEMFYVLGIVACSVGNYWGFRKVLFLEGFMSALSFGSGYVIEEMFYVLGIVACSVGNYWGFRKVLFLGGFMSALSFGSGYVIEEMFYVLGIVACSVGNYWGFRKVLFLGGFMSALSFGSGYVIEEMFYVLGIVACSVGNYWGFRKVLFLGGFMSALSFGSGYVIEEMFYVLGIVACSVGNYWGFRKVLFLGGFMSALSFGSGYVIEEMFYVLGIVACSVGNYWGFRKVLFLGGFMSALSFGSGYVIEEMFYFLIVVGFIGGMAGGFIFVAGLLPAGFYFDKKRAIALGLVSCGSGVGAIVMPQISKVFMDIYGWRMTLVFYAGLFVVLGFMGTLIRPLKPVMVVIKPGSATSLIRKSIAPVSSLDLTLFRFPPPERTSVAPSTTANHSLIGALSAVGTVGGMPTAHPTITQMATDYDAISIRVGESCKPGTLLRLNEMMQDRTQDSAVMPSASTVFPSIYVDENMPIPIRARPWYACGCCRSYEPAVPERPLLRTDLYYTGSIIRLKEYTNMEKDVHYHLHVTKVPTYFETMQDMTRSYTYWCCRNIMTGIRSLVDYTLLMSPTFDILAACGLCMYAGYFLPFLYAKTFLEAWGKGELATTLVSITGFGTMVGRCSSGILVVAVPRFGARTTVGFANIISGVVVTAATFTENIPFVFGCMFIFGFTAGFFAPLRSIIIVDFLGLETLTSATGMMIMFQGCGSFVGAPIAELAMKYTHDGITPYRVSGALLIVAGLILWPMRRVQRWEKKRKERLSGRQTLSTSKD